MGLEDVVVVAVDEGYHLQVSKVSHSSLISLLADYCSSLTVAPKDQMSVEVDQGRRSRFSGLV